MAETNEDKGSVAVDNGTSENNAVSNENENSTPIEEKDSAPVENEENSASTETEKKSVPTEEEKVEKDPFISPVLTAGVLKSLKCALCHKYLSMTPVYTISDDGTKYKCGRCTLIKTHINSRAYAYENLAKHMLFPCVYESCTETLPWKDIKGHEKDCEHRTIKCPALDCTVSLLPKDFASHYKEKHPKYYYTDRLAINNLHNSYGMCLIEKEGESYVIMYDYDQYRFGISVCTFQPLKKQFQVTLSSTGSNYSVALTRHSLTNFEERVHCHKCLKAACKSEFHAFTYHSKGLLKQMATKVERDVIRRMFGSKNVICTVEIVDQKPETEEVDLGDILLGREMIIDEVNDEEENEPVAEKMEEPDIMKEMMQCPSCNEAMIPPIHQCLSGHTFCSECKSKAEKCPTCDSAIENTRNYILEEVAANLKLSDQNEPTEPSESLDKEITCPLAKCAEKVKLSAISDHFKESHINNFHFNKLSLKNVYAYNNIDVLVKNEKVYLVLFDFDDMNFGISMCSLEKDAHQYEVQLMSASGRYAVTAVGQRIILFNEKEHCFKCSLGTCKNNDHTFRKKRKEVFRRLTSKINRDCVRGMFGTSNMNYKIEIVPAKNSAQKDKILRQLLECPICKDYMVPPIHQCVAGHTLCGSCKSKLEKCPSCEGKIEDTRNLLLEDVAEKADLPCQYESENCTFRAGIKRIASHEVECPLKSKKVCVETKKN